MTSIQAVSKFILLSTLVCRSMPNRLPTNRCARYKPTLIPIGEDKILGATRKVNSSHTLSRTLPSASPIIRCFNRSMTTTKTAYATISTSPIAYVSSTIPKVPSTATSQPSTPYDIWCVSCIARWLQWNHRPAL